MSVAQPRARATHRIRTGACTGAMVDPFVPVAEQGPSAQSAWQVVFILLTHEAGAGCGAGLTRDPLPMWEGENDRKRSFTRPSPMTTVIVTRRWYGENGISIRGMALPGPPLRRCRAP